MSYDRIDWHSGGEYPDDLPPENGGIHAERVWMGLVLRQGDVLGRRS